MTTRRVLGVLTTALVALVALVAAGLGRAAPTSADPGERAPRPVRTTISTDDTFDPSAFTITISGTVSASDRRCVAGRVVTVRGADSDPVTGEPVVLGTDRASRRGAYAVTLSLLGLGFGERYTASVARLRTAGPRAVTCTAAKASGVPGP